MPHEARIPCMQSELYVLVRGREAQETLNLTRHERDLARKLIDYAYKIYLLWRDLKD